MGFATGVWVDGRSGSIRGIDHAALGGGHDLDGLAADRRDRGCHAAPAVLVVGRRSALTWWSRRA